MNGWDSLFDEEKRQRKEQYRRKSRLFEKRRHKGKIIHVSGVSPHRALAHGGYVPQRNGSFVKKIDDKNRFHAYIIGENEVEIHTDTVRMDNLGVWHVAGDKQVPKEIKRLQRIMPFFFRE